MRKMNVKDIRKALVVGLGYRTGLAACRFLADRGAAVWASDLKTSAELGEVLGKLPAGVKTVLGAQEPSLLDEGFDAVILSPGVPKSIPLITEACRRGIPVIAEIELAYGHMRGAIIGITGTDGKSTTTTLVGHVLQELGVKALVGGNIGIPLISLVDRTADDTVSVIELSSYQLETIADFRPHAACILNVTPDHLDRYSGMEEYLEAKLRITLNQAADDAFVYNAEDSLTAARLGAVKAAKYRFSLEDKTADAYLDNGRVYLRDRGSAVAVLETPRMKILGLHNVQNAMASVLLIVPVLRRLGIEPDPARIGEAICTFQGLEHRMERVGSFEGRLFINDSKATTVGAVEMAVKSLPGPGVVILGGRTKGDDYSRLARSLEGKIKAVVLLGESKESFSRIFAGFTQALAEDMDDALAQGMRLSGEGDCVLLSPACASFDMYKNFEERGAAFRQSFARLRKGEIPWT